MKTLPLVHMLVDYLFRHHRGLTTVHCLLDIDAMCHRYSFSTTNSIPPYRTSPPQRV